MSKVVFLDPVDYISGKIAKKFRTIYMHCVSTDRRFTQVRNKRATPVKQDELVARERFTQVSRMVATRRKDLMKITADQAAFLAQKDTAGGKKTFFSWYWMVCGEEYDQAHPQG